MRGVGNINVVCIYLGGGGGGGGGGGLKYTVSVVEMAGHVTSNYLYSEPSIFHHLS